MSDIEEDGTPQRWADLPQHERDAMIEFARLSQKHRERIYKAGANIAFWDTLFEKVARWKSLAIVVGLIIAAAALLNALLDSILGSRQ